MNPPVFSNFSLEPENFYASPLEYMVRRQGRIFLRGGARQSGSVNKSQVEK